LGNTITIRTKHKLILGHTPNNRYLGQKFTNTEKSQKNLKGWNPGGLSPKGQSSKLNTG